MLRSGRWLYVLFCCQQAVEKRIKSRIAESGETPPRLHNLMRLAEQAGLKPDGNTANKLRVLTAYYIECRYPDELDALAAEVNEDLAGDVLRDAREVLRWVESQK